MTKAFHPSLGAAAGLLLLAAAVPGQAAGLDDLVAAAKQEGQLTVIALPRDWCGYGALIDSFKAKYGIAVNELNPDGGSGDEVEAIKANKSQQGPAGARRDRRRPVVRPFRQGRRPAAALQGLDLGHDPRRGERRRRLLDRRLLRRAGLRGEHGHREDAARRLAGSAEAGVQGRRRARGRPEGVEPGDHGASMPRASRAARPTPPRRRKTASKFFAELNKNGNFVPAIGKAASIAQGETPVLVFWDYNALAAATP